MSSPRTLFVALASGLLLVASPAAAQSARSEAGLIGQRHFGVDLTYDHFTGSQLDRAHGAAAQANLPLTPALDLGFTYAYADASGPANGAIDQALSVSLLTHRPTEYGTAYFAGALGHGWHRLDLPAAAARDNGAFWGVRAGYEIPAGRRTAVNLGIGYSDSFDRAINGNQFIRYYAEANHRLSRTVAAVVSASYRQIKDAPDATAFSAGLRWAF